jgi:hypothetical protein
MSVLCPRTDIDAANAPAICRAIDIDKAEDVPKALVLSLLRFIKPLIPGMESAEKESPAVGPGSHSVVGARCRHSGLRHRGFYHLISHVVLCGISIAK